MTDSPAHVQAVTAEGQRADQLLTVADVAGRIGAHEPTVRGWIKTGELKAARFGTRIGYRIRYGDYEAFLRRRTLTSAIAVQHRERRDFVVLHVAAEDAGAMGAKRWKRSHGAWLGSRHPSSGPGHSWLDHDGMRTWASAWRQNPIPDPLTMVTA